MFAKKTIKKEMALNAEMEVKIRMETQKRTHFNYLEISLSSLKSPLVRIENHESNVLSCEFHPSGKYILSSDAQGEIHICDIYGTFSTMMIIEGHSGAVMETHFSRDGFDVYSCSADGTLGIWDTVGGARKSKLEGHYSEVNCMERTKSGNPLLCSGSNDGTVRIWDTRESKSKMVLDNDAGEDVTACCFSETGEYVFSGRTDGIIEVWDLRKKEILNELLGHRDRVTGVALSPCGGYLVSNSRDNSLRVWDVCPYADYNRNIRCFKSCQNGMDGLLRCTWSNDGSKIAAGTSLSVVYVWDSDNGDIVYQLAGHDGHINDVAFHPTEGIVLSASSDKYLFMNEIHPADH